MFLVLILKLMLMSIYVYGIQMNKKYNIIFMQIDDDSINISVLSLMTLFGIFYSFIFFFTNFNQKILILDAKTLILAAKA